MSDESSRSARPYGQRRNDGAPAWWAALDRADLPDNEVVPAAHRRWYEEAGAAAPQVEMAGRTASRRGSWVVGVLVALAIAVVLGIAYAVDMSDLQVLTVTLLIGIPVGLAAAVTIFVARRSI